MPEMNETKSSVTELTGRTGDTGETAVLSDNFLTSLGFGFGVHDRLKTVISRKAENIKPAGSFSILLDNIFFIISFIIAFREFF
jgi:hypothetical protein